MYQDNIPLPHPDLWIDLTRRYVTAAVQALESGGLKVDRSWLDPRDPRDATIVYSHPEIGGLRALVWDEVTGWRHGSFIHGRQGIRTGLSGVAYLGGGVLPGGADLLARLQGQISEPRREHRSIADLRDGLDDALANRFS